MIWGDWHEIHNNVIETSHNVPSVDGADSGGLSSVPSSIKPITLVTE